MDDIRIDYSLGEYQSALNSALDKLRKDNIIQRILAKGKYPSIKLHPDMELHFIETINSKNIH